ncbi:ExbD/TolR family protein [Qipengyuania sp. JC766]|uniref:ExbD/TolR family protein n=1 Tax=Qipengyuania sp. JC766 TaxID=3232139 RepID=UPI00345954AC
MAMGMMHVGRKRKGSRRAPMAEINVTPFVDVMLVLLIIFMVTAPLLSAGVPVNLPESRAKALPQAEDPITISMDADGGIYLGSEQMDAGTLPVRLSQIAAEGGELPQVTLRADRLLPYGNVMAVMGELNRYGFTRIDLVNTAAVSAPASIGGSEGEP